MREAVSNPLQLRLECDFPDASGRKTANVFQPKLPVYSSTRPPSPSEQASLIDKRIKSEISELRVVEKGETVRIQAKSGYLTRVFLEEDAILQRMPQKNGRRKRYVYYTRVPVIVRSVKFGNIWTVDQGKNVDTFSKQTIISNKLLPRVMPRLRWHTIV